MAALVTTACWRTGCGQTVTQGYRIMTSAQRHERHVHQNHIVLDVLTADLINREGRVPVHGWTLFDIRSGFRRSRKGF